MRVYNRVGEKYDNFGYSFTIIVYNKRKDCTIQFEDGTILENINFSNIVAGKIKNPNSPNIYGVGFIGIGKYSSKEYKKIYSVWGGMFRRCYGKEVKYKTYKDCIVDKHWHNFQNFAKWYEENWKPWMVGWHLDKDVKIRGNKIYSDKTCCFLPVEINSLLTNRKNHRGDLPIGVIKKGCKYVAQITKNNNHINIDSLSTPEEAFKKYKEFKELWIKEVANLWKNKINTDAYNTLINWKIEITD